ncbi:MAG TPA: hypothetical protein ENK91_10400 [Bacteroidetes bacterium]|nr:hypothetical protein [Bacteroidota bacterium]
MKKFLTLIVIVTILISCKNNQQNSHNNITDSEKKEMKDTIKDISTSRGVEEKQVTVTRNIQEDRAKAKKEIEDKLSQNPKIWEPLVLNYYIVDYISEGQSAPKDIIDMGEWYKFDKDFRYQHGFFNKTIENGRYSIDIDKKILLLLPDEEDVFPSEWKLLNSADVIVMVGTAKFGNNPVQKHTQNVVKKPEIIE